MERVVYAQMKIQGVYIAVAAPFNHRGELWEVKVQHNAAKWARTTISGFVIGDREALSDEEKRRMRELIAESAPEKALLEAGEIPEHLHRSDAGFAEALGAGAQGVISTIANAAPYAMISIWEAHRTRDFEAAADWQNRLAAGIAMIEGANGIAALKHAMDLNGYYGGPPRLPSTVLRPDEKIAIERAFDGIRG